MDNTIENLIKALSESGARVTYGLVDPEFDRTVCGSLQHALRVDHAEIVIKSCAKAACLHTYNTLSEQFVDGRPVVLLNLIDKLMRLELEEICDYWCALGDTVSKADYNDTEKDIISRLFAFLNLFTTSKIGGDILCYEFCHLRKKSNKAAEARSSYREKLQPSLMIPESQASVVIYREAYDSLLINSIFRPLTQFGREGDSESSVPAQVPKEYYCSVYPTVFLFSDTYEGKYTDKAASMINGVRGFKNRLTRKDIRHDRLFATPGSTPDTSIVNPLPCYGINVDFKKGLKFRIETQNRELAYSFCGLFEFITKGGVVVVPMCSELLNKAREISTNVKRHLIHSIGINNNGEVTTDVRLVDLWCRALVKFAQCSKFIGKDTKSAYKILDCFCNGDISKTKIGYSKIKQLLKGMTNRAEDDDTKAIIEELISMLDNIIYYVQCVGLGSSEKELDDFYVSYVTAGKNTAINVSSNIQNPQPVIHNSSNINTYAINRSNTKIRKIILASLDLLYIFVSASCIYIGIKYLVDCKDILGKVFNVFFVIAGILNFLVGVVCFYNIFYENIQDIVRRLDVAKSGSNGKMFVNVGSKALDSSQHDQAAAFPNAGDAEQSSDVLSKASALKNAVFQPIVKNESKVETALEVPAIPI